MTEEQQKVFIDGQYDSLQKYRHKRNANIYFNIIDAKTQLGLTDYRQSLYIDVKKYIQAYITAADSLDYGYDELRIDKIFIPLEHLEHKQQLALLSQVRRMFYTRGYDQDVIYDKINTVDMTVSWKDGNYKKVVRLWLSASLYRLLAVYLGYITLIGLVLLPAPFKFMELFSITFKSYSDVEIINHIANTIAFVIGNDDVSPTIESMSTIGIIMYSLGQILFYVLFANFILKKIEDYITLK